MHCLGMNSIVLLSVTDAAIKLACNTGNLRISEKAGRLGQYWSIEDQHGMIEVALSRPEAEQRVASICN
jgi:hypothetical protein